MPQSFVAFFGGNVEINFNRKNNKTIRWPRIAAVLAFISVAGTEREK
ncbi:MAG TPA: hypothetical protein VMT76_16940 [Puia sp.]|nr:hypothetical protein [Puia sp.]